MFKKVFSTSRVCNVVTKILGENKKLVITQCLYSIFLLKVHAITYQPKNTHLLMQKDCTLPKIVLIVPNKTGCY